MFNILFLHSS